MMNLKPWMKDLIWYVCLALVLVTLRVFVFTPVTVRGDSMNPSLVDGERMIVLKRSKIERADVVTFPAPDQPNKKYVKRVIGVPGDTIEFKDDKLLVNKKEVKEPYLNETKKLSEDDEIMLPKGFPVTKDFQMEEVSGQKKVPEGTFFVMGDNRQNSNDSRNPAVGFINESDLIGEAKFSFWPLSKFGTVK